MRNGFRRINCILHFVGGLLEILGLVLLSPLIFVVVYWGQMGDGWITGIAFVVTALISFSLGLVLRNKFESEALDTTGSMLMCAVGWLCVCPGLIVSNCHNYLPFAGIGQ